MAPVKQRFERIRVLEHEQVSKLIRSFQSIERTWDKVTFGQQVQMAMSILFSILMSLLKYTSNSHLNLFNQSIIKNIV